MKVKAFTLIELMVVVAIVGMLAAALLPSISGIMDRARVAKAEAEVRSIANAILALNQDTGLWPAGNVQGSALNGANMGLISRNAALWPATWDGPYLEKSIGNGGDGLDPWGRAYVYDGGEAGSGQTCIASVGPDGVIASYNRADLTAQGDDIIVYFNQRNPR
ncbi:MAG: type II secretion system protein GspG [Candidatus Omnitrophota bacterium]